MTVAELIHELSVYRDDLEVVVDCEKASYIPFVRILLGYEIPAVAISAWPENEIDFNDSEELDKPVYQDESVEVKSNPNEEVVQTDPLIDPFDDDLSEDELGAIEEFGKAFEEVLKAIHSVITEETNESEGEGK